eukprot:gene7873-7941_t
MQTFDGGTIDAERNVIIEEARQRGKDAQERMQSQILPLLLNNSRYADRLPIGKEDIIKSFAPKTIESFFHDWYRPDLQAIIAIGDFDVQQVVKLIEAKFSRLTNPMHEQPRAKFSIPFAHGTVIKTITDSEFPYTLAEIVLFNEMINARLGELSQKKDAPFLFAQMRYSGFVGDQDALITTVIAKSPEQLKHAVQATTDEIERTRKFGFTNGELDRAKNNALTHIENAFKKKDENPSINFAREYQQNFLFGDAIPGIDFEYLLIEAPEKDKAMLPNNQQIVNCLNYKYKTKHVPNFEDKAAPDSEYLSASFSPGIIGSSGIDEMSEEELEKKLSGKSKLPKGYQPRMDQNIWQAQIAQTKASLANRYLDPASVFQDTVAAVLGSHNYRQMPLTPERLSAISSKKGFNFYNAHFADASGFTNKEHGVYLPGVKASYTKIPASRYALTVYFTCAPENTDKLINATMDEIQELKNHGAKADDIQKYKEDEQRSLERIPTQF